MFNMNKRRSLKNGAYPRKRKNVHGSQESEGACTLVEAALAQAN